MQNSHNITLGYPVENDPSSRTVDRLGSGSDLSLENEGSFPLGEKSPLVLAPSGQEYSLSKMSLTIVSPDNQPPSLLREDHGLPSTPTFDEIVEFFRKPVSPPPDRKWKMAADVATDHVAASCSCLCSSITPPDVPKMQHQSLPQLSPLSEYITKLRAIGVDTTMLMKTNILTDTTLLMQGFSHTKNNILSSLQFPLYREILIDLGLFIASASSASSWTGVIAILTTYVRTTLKTFDLLELNKMIAFVIDTITNKVMSLQSTATEKFSSLVSVLSGLRDNFSAFVKSDIAVKLLKTIAAVMTLGVSNIAGIPAKLYELVVVNTSSVNLLKAGSVIACICDLSVSMLVSINQQFQGDEFTIESLRANLLNDTMNIITEIQKEYPNTLLRSEGHCSILLLMDKIQKALSQITLLSKDLPISQRIQLARHSNELSMMFQSLTVSHQSDSSRYAPLGIVITGPPKTGKTLIVTELFQCIGTVNSFPCDPKHLYTNQPNNTFDVAANNQHTGVLIDDLGSGPPGRQSNQYEYARGTINNTPMYTVQAECDKKDKIPINYRVAFITTNHTDSELGAAVTGELLHTTALTRRLLRITPKVKRAFRDPDGIRIRDDVAMGTDVNTYTISKSSIGTTPAGSLYTIWTDLAVNISKAELFRFIAAYAKVHDAKQKALISIKGTKLKFCEHGVPTELLCTLCDPGFDYLHLLDPDEGHVSESSSDDDAPDPPRRREGAWGRGGHRRNPRRMVRQSISSLEDENVTMPRIPFVRIFLMIVKNYDVFSIRLFQSLTAMLICFYLMVAIIAGIIGFLYSTTLSYVISSLFVLYSMLMCRRSVIMLEYNILKSRNTVEYEKECYSASVEKVYSLPLRCAIFSFKTCAAVAGLYSIHQLYNSTTDKWQDIDEVLEDENDELDMKRVISDKRKVAAFDGFVHDLWKQHSSRNPHLKEDVSDQEEEAPMEHQGSAPLFRTSVPNKWVVDQGAEYTIPAASLTTSMDELVSTMWKRMACFSIKNNDTGVTAFVRSLPYKSTVWIVPAHSFKDKDATYSVSMLRGPPTPLLTFMKATVRSKDISVHPSSDLALVNIPQFHPQKDNSKFISNTYKTTPRRCKFLCVNQDSSHKNTKGGVFCSSALAPTQLVATVATPGKYHVDDTTLSGLTYTLPYNTFNGLCGGIIISEHSTILSIHVAGCVDSGESVGAMLFRDELDNMAKKFSLYPSETCFVAKPIEPHAKFEGNFAHMVPNNAIHTELRVDSRSPFSRKTIKGRTIISPFSKEITDILEIPLLHQEQVSEYPYTTYVKKLSNKTGGIKPEILDKATKSQFDSYCKVYDRHNLILHTFDIPTAINGCDDTSYVDRIKMATSAGLPFRQKKKAFFHLDPPVEDHAINYAMNPNLEDIVNVAKEHFLNGEQCPYHLCDANIKDEAQKLGSTKNRVFLATSLSSFIIGRQMFGSFIQHQMNYNFEFSSAVGIDTCSDQWTELYEKIIKFGLENIVAGDFKDWDVTIPLEIALAAADIIYDLHVKYSTMSPEDLIILKACLSELVYPVLEVNGTILRPSGMNASGNVLTVHFNNLCNALLARAAFFTFYPDADTDDFDKYIASIFFGDDNLFGVHSDYSKFNHTALVKFFSSLGMTFTMPNKEDESVPFVHISEVDFVKRSFRFDEDLQCMSAPIARISISKMLHTTLPSSHIEYTEQLASNIDDVMREFFQYGQVKYNDMCAKMNLFIDHISFRDFVPSVPTYVEMTHSMSKRYINLQK